MKNSTFGFLRRNLRVRSCDTKSAAYATLVGPTYVYCASVWNPHTVRSQYKLEMAQRRAATYCTNRHHDTSSVPDMLQDLGWETLESRRTKLQLATLYKLINDLVAVSATPYLTSASTRIRAIHTKKLLQHPTKTDTFKFSFFPRVISVWNSLSAEIAEAPNLVHFKQVLSSLKL